MPRRRLTTGELGWIGLATYVVIVDSIAWRNQVKGEKDETMSLSFGRWLQNPKGRAVTGLAWGLVTFHLFLSTPLPGGKTLKKAVTTGTLRKMNGNKE
jgi:hypothetical protein